MYIDPMVAINEYELRVRDAEERIDRLRALEERRSRVPTQARPASTRRAGMLRRLLPRHGA